MINCSKCGIEKSKEEYYERTKVCKSCRRKDARIRYNSKNAYNTKDFTIEDRIKIQQLMSTGVSLRKICKMNNYSYQKCLRRLRQNPEYFKI